MRTSLKSFKWNQPDFRTFRYPLDLSPAEFLSQLARFDKLETPGFDTILVSRRSIFGSSGLPLPIPALRLVSLTHTIGPVNEEAPSEDGDDTDPSKRFVPALMRCTCKETLRELSFDSPEPFDAALEQLR